MNHTHTSDCGHVLTGTIDLYDGNYPYSAAVIARGTNDPQQLGWTVASVMARTDEEATELALELARIKWPAGQGWQAHEAIVTKMARSCPESA